MFGLTPWNTYQELMSWHRDIDELFNRVFPSSRAEQEQQSPTVSWLPAIETFTQEGQFNDLELSRPTAEALVRGECLSLLLAVEPCHLQ